MRCSLSLIHQLRSRPRPGGILPAAAPGALIYLEAWSLALTGSPLPWPAPEGLVMRFSPIISGSRSARQDPEHGMPAEVAVALQAQDLLRVSGPHAPSTVKRRLAHCGGHAPPPA